MNFDQLDTLDQLSISILEALYRASWQGAIAAALVWSLCSLFPRLPAAARSWLWRLVFLKMILAVIWTRPIELALLAPTETQAPSSRIAALLPNSANSEISTISPPNVPVPTDVQNITEPALSFPRPLGREGQGEGVAVEAESIQAPLEPIIAMAAQRVPLWSAYWRIPITLFWSSGVLLGLALLAHQFRHARTLHRNSTRCTDETRVIHPCIALARAIGLIRLPEIRTSTTATRPMLIGLIRPTLILPAQLLATASPESLRMMIAHELAHIRRADLAWTILTALVRTIFFFHPLGWLARRESLLAQEIACDELALRITSSPATRYAEMLVDVVSLPPSPAPALITLGVAESRNTLERRIRHMKFIGHKKSKLIQFITATALLTALIALIPFQLVAAQPETVENRPDSTVPAVKPDLAEKGAQETRQVDAARSQRLKDELFPEQLKDLTATAGNPREPNSARFWLQPGEAARILEQIPGKDLRQILPTLTGDTLLTELLKSLAEAEQKYVALQNDYADQHPEVIKIRSVLKQINHQIENRIEGILASLQVKADAEAQSEHHLQNRRDFLKGRIAEMERELERSQQTLETDADARTRYFQLKRELEDSERELARLNGRQPAQSIRDPARVIESNPAAPTRAVPVHARAGGVVQSVLVKTGDTVKKGDRLLLLDHSAAERQLHSANLRATIARADVDIARSELAQIEKQYQEVLKKIEVGAAGQLDLPNIEKTRANVIKADAHSELAELGVREARSNLNDLTLHAPVDGVVTFIIHEGYHVPEGSSKMLAQIQTEVNQKQAAAEALQNLKDELAKLKEKEAELLLKYRSRYPGVQTIRRQIATLEARIRAEEAEAKTSN